MFDFLNVLANNAIYFIINTGKTLISAKPTEMEITIETLGLLNNITNEINVMSVSQVCEQYVNHSNLSSMAYDACVGFFNVEDEENYLPSTQNMVIASLTGLAIIGSTILIKRNKDSREHSLSVMRMPSLAERGNENQFPHVELGDGTRQFNCALSQSAMEQPCWVITGNKNQYVHAFDAGCIENMLRFTATQEIQTIQQTLAQYDDAGRQTYKKDVKRHEARLAILQSEDGWKAVTCENPLNRQEFTWEDVHQAPEMCALMQKYIEQGMSEGELELEIAAITDNKRATVERSKYCFWL